MPWPWKAGGVTTCCKSIVVSSIWSYVRKAWSSKIKKSDKKIVKIQKIS